MAGRSRREIGLRIQAVRKRSGLTQEQLAAAIGKAPESISNIERGTQSPTVDTLIDLAAALQMPVLDLIVQKTDHGGKSDLRLRLEAKLWSVVRSVPDTYLALLVGQAELLGKFVQNSDKIED